MSSQHRDPVGEPPPPKPKWFSYWPKWRRIMMAGALILLAGSLVPAIMGAENAPAGLTNATWIIGYVLLAYGFILAMRARRAPEQTARNTEDETAGSSDDEERAEVLEEES